VAAAAEHLAASYGYIRDSPRTVGWSVLGLSRDSSLVRGATQAGMLKIEQADATER